MVIQDRFLRKLTLKSCPACFPLPQLSPPASLFPCVLDSGQALKVERTWRTFSAAQRIDVSRVTLVIPWGERGTAILATGPPAVNWLPDISECWVEWVGHRCRHNLVDKAKYSFWSWLSRVTGNWPLESLLCGKWNTASCLCYRLEWLSFLQCTLAIGITSL